VHVGYSPVIEFRKTLRLVISVIYVIFLPDYIIPRGYGFPLDFVLAPGGFFRFRYFHFPENFLSVFGFRVFPVLILGFSDVLNLCFPHVLVFLLFSIEFLVLFWVVSEFRVCVFTWSRLLVVGGGPVQLWEKLRVVGFSPLLSECVVLVSD